MSNNMSRRRSSPKHRRHNAQTSRKTKHLSKGKKSTIHPSRFVQKAQFEAQDEYVPKHSFHSFSLHGVLKDKLLERNFAAPSPIQDQLIPHGIAGRDVVGLANTGTGKTMAFALPVLDKLMRNKRSAALIIAPTRELAEQILEECKTLTHQKHLSGVLLIGGVSMHRQLQALAKHPRLIVGTPGRIEDHIGQGSLDLSRFDTLVLDEFDRMLDMGFIQPIRRIVSKIPSANRQSLFFSATTTPAIQKIIQEMSSDPVEVSVIQRATTANVDQDVVYFDETADKLQKLTERLDSNQGGKILIFDATKRRVDRLVHKLRRSGYEADAIHGGKNQSQRRRVLQRFKDDEVNILVATDVAARGIDVDNITHVINYTAPQGYDDYTHRIGRAGRAGKKGFALTFVER